MHRDHYRLYRAICLLFWGAWLALAAFAAVVLWLWRQGAAQWVEKSEILGLLIGGTILCLGFPLALRLLLWLLARRQPPP